jgi:hypothetical protein
MVSAEKVFRMYVNPMDAGKSRILVDRKIDTFLKEHFLEYKFFAIKVIDSPDDPQYVTYIGTNENPQYDDLTIMGLCRKVIVNRDGILNFD